MSDDTPGAKVIPLFKEDVPRADRVRKKPLAEGTAVTDLLSLDLQESIADVQHSLDQLYLAESVAEFVAEVNRIRAEVKRWPRG